MWITLGLGALGLLIGGFVGLTASPVVTSLIPLIFTLMGGSIIVMLKSMLPDDRDLAGKMLFAFATLCLVGTLGGVWLTEHHTLSPAAVLSSQIKADAASYKSLGFPAGQNKYLRSLNVDAINAIDTQYRNGLISDKQAYQSLYDLLTASTKSNTGTGDAGK